MKAHEVGAEQQAVDKWNAAGWQSMATAPRDGTVVELKCTYGVAPWYGLFRWIENHWEKHGESRTGVQEGVYLFWRPYPGDPDSYVDPTHGMQTDMAYWRGAVASEAGLPADYFEHDKSLWRRFFGR